MDRIVAFDPGDTHVGMALFYQDPEGPASTNGWRCLFAIEVSPDKAADDLAALLLEKKISAVVCEQFRLYPDKAAEQIGSEFYTSQLIGVITYLVRLNNRHHRVHAKAQPGDRLTCADWCRGGPPEVELKIQPADIKNATTGLLRRRRIKSKAKAAGTNTSGNHPLDAELHGWCYLIRERGLDKSARV